MDREEEFRVLFASEYPQVMRAVFFILHDQDRAEEITQDAFMQLLRHWRKVCRYELPQAWVRRVALRLAVKSAQRERRITSALLRTGPASSVDVSTRVAQHSDVFAAIGRLTPKERVVVVLFYFEDRSTAEIAQLLECSENAASIRLHRARQRMAELLREENVDVG